MFSKVLIGNRGAIAVRIIRTLKSMGVASVAVYAESDANSLHVRLADEAFSLGEGGASETYLNVDKLLTVAQKCSAEAVHPGYGFLSENAEFVGQCEDAGLVFIGPTPEQMLSFGLKHSARALAEKANVPLLPGSELLNNEDDAVTTAGQIGYPIMLKSTAGGGGIGMQLCADEAELRSAFDSVKRLGASNFSNDGVFLEKFIARARHIEVQMFGDGQGGALALGERDCSSQRRNQKVVEECPAPNLSDSVRTSLKTTAEMLLASVNYRNAGTVEFIVDADSEAFYFLEVNTRLQVEHGVTEEVFGVDLVEWMLRQAAGESPDLKVERERLITRGHSIQVRLYAEDPYLNFQPCPGLLTEVKFPSGDGVRIDTWVEAGIEVPPYFDPMLAKIIVHADNREQALDKLQQTLAATRLYGSETNLGYLQALVADKTLALGKVTTRYLNDFSWQPNRIDVRRSGTQTTIQDVPGRRGYWNVGVPPSGPFDSHSFRLANQLLGNSPDAAGLEIIVQGPLLTFSSASQVVIAGADTVATLDGEPVTLWTVIDIAAGQSLDIGKVTGDKGMRCYLCINGGLQCPGYLGSRSTFTLGQFGGHNGRPLIIGDVLHLPEPASAVVKTPRSLPTELRPTITSEWQVRVIYGPHGAPDFFTDSDIAEFFAARWEVHYNSSRTGVRLIGPKPEWARKDGGEAGLHPSNIHDNAYAFGTIDFTGDMPVILGPDGPSLGGFVCPATVIQADLWKLGQLSPGDTIEFLPVSYEQAVMAEQLQNNAISTLTRSKPTPLSTLSIASSSPVIDVMSADEFGDEIICRAAGDHFLLVEYGEQTLDLRLRFRAHALMQWLDKNSLDGLLELTPGIRSLQLHFDSQVLDRSDLLAHVRRAEQDLATKLDSLSVPSRTVHIPLSWDDEACRQAIDKYMQSVREDAPWCPSNLEFIRRINGLDCIDDVKRIVFDASYLVMGLGDVYLGAPVATPVDPTHRLVTTKYNPARTWTAENSVGIGGSYMCIYGMEGPGGYQFVGRTLQMWNRYRETAEFKQPWLLRFFDQIKFYEVSHEELQTIRRDFPQGRYPLKIEQGEFSYANYQQLLDEKKTEIEAFTGIRQQAFADELANWHATGKFHYSSEIDEVAGGDDSYSLKDGEVAVESSVSGSLWQTEVTAGQQVEAGQLLMILESMKMEIEVQAPVSGRVQNLLVQNGNRVTAGMPLLIIKEDS